MTCGRYLDELCKATGLEFGEHGLLVRIQATVVTEDDRHAAGNLRWRRGGAPSRLRE